MQAAYGRLLDAKKRDLLTALDQTYDEIEKFAAGEEVLRPVVSAADQERLALRASVNGATSITELYALERRIGSYRDGGYTKIYDARNAAEGAARAAERERRHQQQVGQGTTAARKIQPAVVSQPVPRPADIKRIPRSEALPPVRLSSDGEIDAFVEKLRAQLKDALRGHDGIQFVG